MHSSPDLVIEAADRPIASDASSRGALRRKMRTLRRALTPRERALAARRFALIAKRVHLLRPGQRIALYLPFGGEADTSALIELARSRHCIVHLPVITNHRTHRMRFARFERGAELRRNRYGISEPKPDAGFVRVQHLDLIVVPLVAVDARGARLGSGAGFYDRCLRHLRSARRWRRPRLIGLAYEFQRVPSIAAHPWDVPVDAVLTEVALHPAARHNALIARTS
jgi:5-formyltetrahydrofolate cyclo-ligase